MPLQTPGPVRLNPRWALWMTSRGEDPASFVPAAPGEDCPRVLEAGGSSLPRPLAFSLWIRARWAEWAAGLGFRNHEGALRAGHTHEAFDAWLMEKVRADAEKGRR